MKIANLGIEKFEGAKIEMDIGIHGIYNYNPNNFSLGKSNQPISN
jgi:hypothetical protein